MSWLKFCQKNWPTLMWKPEGCRLRPFTGEEIKALGDVDGTEAEPNDVNRARSMLKWKYWSGSRQVTELRGINIHGTGKLHVDRMAIIKDIPFWATKWLVFERDKKCQDCGAYGWESHLDMDSRNRQGYAKEVYDKPLFQADIDAYMKKYETDYYSYADPEDSKGLQVHHIIAVTDGGSNCTENTMLLCWRCHQRRGGKGGLPYRPRNRAAEVGVNGYGSLKSA